MAWKAFSCADMPIQYYINPREDAILNNCTSIIATAVVSVATSTRVWYHSYLLNIAQLPVPAVSLSLISDTSWTGFCVDRLYSSWINTLWISRSWNERKINNDRWSGTIAMRSIGLYRKMSTIHSIKVWNFRRRKIKGFEITILTSSAVLFSIGRMRRGLYQIKYKIY